MAIPAIAAAYFVTAKLGLSMAFQAEQVSLVWPATGFALAVTLLAGFRVWPGIALGAFLANVTAPDESAAVACGIAAGNTLEAVAGAWLLRRAGFAYSLDKLSDVVKFIVLAAGASTTISATIGVTSLCLGDIQPWNAFGPLWTVWWLGDSMGNLVVAPMLLTCAAQREHWPLHRLPEAFALLAGLIVTTFVVFTGQWTENLQGHPLAFAVFPFVIWAALRFGQQGTTVAIVVAACVALVATLHNPASSDAESAHERLIVLQMFMGVVAVSALLLGAAISERRRAVEELRADVAWRKELERELHRRAEQLAEADRRKDEFLAMLGHELRNPLAPISNCLQLLRLSDGVSPPLEQIRKIMERQVNHMVRLVDDLLEVSRITRGKIELRKQPVELAALVESAVETSRPLIEAAGHTLTVALPSEPVQVEADPVRLAQVIANLLNNAAKYTDLPGEIWLTARREGEQAVVSVRDSGLGISPEVLPHVFDMFSQADSTRTRTQGGLGIGLTLAKRLIDMHGGHIEAHSAGLGKGSEFIVRLPLVLGPPAANAVAVTASRNNGAPFASRRILVVDDAPAAAETLASLLAAMGHQVRTALSAATALEMVRVERPEVVIADIAMPHMDGYELARRLRREPGLEHLLLVALTGYGQQRDQRQAIEAGFDHHLVKPASAEVLRDLLASLTRGFEAASAGCS